MTIQEGEFDIQPYLLEIWRYRWRLLLAGVLAGILAFFLINSFPDTYNATATLIMIRSRPTLSIADQFPTINETVDLRSRMEAFLTIARSNAIAKASLERLQENSTRNQLTLDTLMNAVEMETKGDAILITATWVDPELTAEIANLWAQEASRAINQAYSGEQPLSEIQTQIANVNKEYTEAQEQLEAFVATNRIQVLENRITEAKNLYTSLIEDRNITIAYYQTRKQEMEKVINQVTALRNQLESSGGSVSGNLGDALAVLGVRASVFGTEMPLNIDFQIQSLEALLDTNADYRSDLNLLIDQAGEERSKAEQRLIELAREVTNGELDPLLEDLAAEIRALEKQLEQEKARERELSSERDLTWETYQALTQKVTEIRTAAQASNQVTLGSAAVTPGMPAPKNTIIKAILATALAMTLGVTGVIAANWWSNQGKPQTQQSFPSHRSDEINPE